MYAQMIDLHVPLEQMGALRHLIDEVYLPVAKQRDGFVAGYLLERVDDDTRAHLVLLWEDYSAYEQHRKTTLLSGSEQSIAARMQGLRMDRQECIIRVSTERATARS